MKRTHKLISVAVLAALAVANSQTASAAIIANGNLNTEVSQWDSVRGDSGYYLDTSTLDVLEDQAISSGGGASNANTGRDAGEWVWSSLTRGFAYDPDGGAEGPGDGAFVDRPGADFNSKPRAVAQFVNDGSATTGQQTVSMDVFMDDNTGANTLTFLVELYGWNAGDTGPKLSLGGADANNPAYNVTTLGGATEVLSTAVAAASVTDATWQTVNLGNVDLGTGYDYYVWRIGILGATAGDDFAFDNLTVIPEPSSSLLAGLFVAGTLLCRRRGIN